MKKNQVEIPDQSGRLQKARIGLILDEPFFGALVMNLKASFTESVKTFATDGVRLLCNPTFAASLADDEFRGVLAHEVLHCALGHIFRRGDRDKTKWNMATDYIINQTLVEYNEASTKAGRPAPFPLPKGALLDPQYSGMSAEQIYSLLPDPGEQDVQDAQDGQPGSGEGQGDFGPGECMDTPGDEAQQAEQEAQWRVATQNAATCAKSVGKLPGSMKRLVEELLDPKVPWTQVLRDLLTTLCRDDYSWARPNTRYASGGFVLPSLRSERLGVIAVAVDTSGSIGAKELSEFTAEMQSILDECRPLRVVLYQCDAQIHERLEFEPGQDIRVEMKGGGGTDFRPVFTAIEAEEEQPVALVYLTDAYGSFPDMPPTYPVVWAVKGEGATPWGERVELN